MFQQYLVPTFLVMIIQHTYYMYSFRSTAAMYIPNDHQRQDTYAQFTYNYWVTARDVKLLGSWKYFDPRLSKSEFVSRKWKFFKVQIFFYLLIMLSYESNDMSFRVLSLTTERNRTTMLMAIWISKTKKDGAPSEVHVYFNEKTS